jgi:hypothetical protein
MPRFPGEYSLLFKVADASLSTYLSLDDDEHKAIKLDLRREIRETIDIAQLEAWDFSHNKILAESGGYKEEEDVSKELESVVSPLGINGNKVSVRPGDTFVAPVAIEYDKQFDCGLSCHHSYAIHLDKGDGKGYRPWLITSPSNTSILFELRAAFMWVMPPEAFDGILTVAKIRPESVRQRRGLAAPVGRTRKGRTKKSKARA